MPVMNWWPHCFKPQRHPALLKLTKFYALDGSRSNAQVHREDSYDKERCNFMISSWGWGWYWHSFKLIILWSKFLGFEVDRNVSYGISSVERHFTQAIEALSVTSPIRSAWWYLSLGLRMARALKTVMTAMMTRLTRVMTMMTSHLRGMM